MEEEEDAQAKAKEEEDEGAIQVDDLSTISPALDANFGLLL